MHLHAFIFFFIDISTIVLEALVIKGNEGKLKNVDALDTDTKDHFVIGCVILAILIL